MEYLEKLSTLFSFHSMDLLQQLNTKGVLAGGSIVYALNDFVPKESVGDIDVFINDKETFLQVLEDLRFCYRVDKIEVTNPEQYYELSEEESEKISIVSVTLIEERVQIQLILQEYESPFDVIESFDLDYVQCALHKDKIFQTEICKEAHFKRKILCGNEFPPSFKRLQKASQKGFKTVLIGNEIRPIKYRPFEEALSKDQLEFMVKREKIREKFRFDDFSVKGFIADTKSKYDLNTVMYGYFQISNESLTMNVKYISIAIKVIENICDDAVQIEPLDLGKRKLEFCKNKTGKKILPGDYIAKVEAYYHSFSDKFKFKIYELYSSDVSPISFSKDFKLDLSKFPSLIKLSLINNSLDKVKVLIKKYSEGSRCTDDHKSNLAWAKRSAYEAFLYHKEREGEEKAIQEACRQMAWDAEKIRGRLDALGCFTLMQTSRNYRTVEEMIHFIEGFN